jgi:putrescine aminotransferase
MTITAAALHEANARHMLHPMIDPKAVAAAPPLIIERGDGVHVYDLDGRRYLDTVASLWNVNVGHNRAEVKAAINAQLERLAYYSTFQNTSNPPAIELSARLMQLFAPERMRKVLFSSGGSDAVETAMKLARQYWQLQGRAQRHKFISLKLGYHGVHFGGASVNGNPQFRQAYEPLLGAASRSTRPTSTATPGARPTRHAWRACAPTNSTAPSSTRARTPWRPSSPNRCRARAA